MEKCYEYLGCTNEDCIMFSRKGTTPCWEVEGTLCSHNGIEIVLKKMKSKLDACIHCIYYQSVNETRSTYGDDPIGS